LLIWLTTNIKLIKQLKVSTLVGDGGMVVVGVGVVPGYVVGVIGVPMVIILLILDIGNNVLPAYGVLKL
jgi:hypothetical protein